MEKTEIEDPSSKKGKESIYSKSSRPQKFAASFVFYYCTFAYGMAISFFGPLIIDYSYKFNTEVSHVSYVFTISLVGFVSGAFLNGVINRWVNRQIFVIVLFTIASVIFFIFPHVTSIEVFFVMAAIIGIYGGGYESAQIAWIIDMWRHESAPFLLTQYLSFSLGTVIPPLILSPFLQGAETSHVDEEGNSNLNLTSALAKNDNEKEGGSDLSIPFAIAGCILLLALLMQVALGLYYRMKHSDEDSGEKTIKEPDADTEAKVPMFVEESDKKSDGEKEGKSKSKYFPECRELILIVLSCCFIAFYAGMDWCTMQFLPTFAHFSTVAFSESQGADLLFGFTMAFCIGRAIGIFVILKAPPHFIICVNLVLITISNLILVLFADDSVKMMWIGSVLYGLSLSTTLPSYFAFIEKYVFVSDSVAAVICITAGVVCAIYPLVVGNSVETNPTIMIYVNFFSLAVIACSFCVIFWLTLCKKSSK